MDLIVKSFYRKWTTYDERKNESKRKHLPLYIKFRKLLIRKVPFRFYYNTYKKKIYQLFHGCGRLKYAAGVQLKHNFGDSNERR